MCYYTHAGCCSHCCHHHHHYWWQTYVWPSPVALTVLPHPQVSPPPKLEMKVGHLEIKADTVTIHNKTLAKKRSSRW